MWQWSVIGLYEVATDVREQRCEIRPYTLSWLCPAKSKPRLQKPSISYQTMTEGKGKHCDSGSWTGLKQKFVLISNDEMALHVSILSMEPVNFE